MSSYQQMFKLSGGKGNLSFEKISTLSAGESLVRSIQIVFVLTCVFELRNGI